MNKIFKLKYMVCLDKCLCRFKVHDCLLSRVWIFPNLSCILRGLKKFGQHLCCWFNFEMCVGQVEMLPNFFQSSKITQRNGKNPNPRRETIMNLKPVEAFI